MARFTAQAFLKTLQSSGLKDWINNLRQMGVFDERREERTVQAYIVSYIFHHCFFSSDSVYDFRALKVEYRPNPKGKYPIPDILMMSTTHAKVVDVWLELKEYIGKGGVPASEIEDLEWDFEKTNDVFQGNGDSIGIVLIVGDDVDAIQSSIHGLREKYPNSEVVIIGSRDIYAD